MVSATAPVRESLLLGTLEKTAPKIGVACVSLLGNLTWIRRRSETATFRAYETVRLSSTLDVVIPSDTLELLRLDPPAASAPTKGHTSGAQRIVLPLDVLEKGSLTHFDLTVDGMAASLLSAREAAFITAWILVTVAVDAKEQTVDREIFELLRRIAGTDAAASHRAYDELEKVRRLSPKLLSEARKYRDKYLLLAELAIEQPHVIVKYARDVSLKPNLKWEQRLGLRGAVLRVPLGSIAFAGSYHVEAVVPDELKVWGAQLTHKELNGVLCERDDICDRASLYVSGEKLDQLAGPGRHQMLDGQLTLGVATHRSVLLFPAAIIASIAALALLVGGGLALNGVLGKSISGSTGSAVFLAPSIAAGLVLYRSEASLVRVMLGLARAALAFVSGLAFAGGATLAFGVRDVELGVCWLVLGLLAGVGAILLSVAAVEAIAEVP